ncbi:hypothetical protein [Streptomyces gardneri]|uniref:hypothetical protein n=1 Tax=Streptomyces gardneri TaxID=66892 RepID=UPI0036BBF2D6
MRPRPTPCLGGKRGALADAFADGDGPDGPSGALLGELDEIGGGGPVGGVLGEAAPDERGELGIGVRELPEVGLAVDPVEEVGPGPVTERGPPVGLVQHEFTAANFPGTAPR